MMKINFISSKESDKNQSMHYKSDKAEVMIGYNTNELLTTFLVHFTWDTKCVRNSVSGNDFAFDSIDRMY